MPFCTICKDVKDFDDFHKDSSRSNGVKSRCKECDRVYCREWYRKKHLINK